MKLIVGNLLTEKARREVLAAYVYRLTTENNYPRINPCHARCPAISDAEWLKTRAFYITKDGHLSARHRHAVPAYMAEGGI